MKKLFYAIFPLAALLLLTTCEEELPNTMGNIYGIVGDMETGDPIRGASVTLSPGNRSTVTGSDGHFEFLNLEATQYKIQVSANGYVTNSRQITVLSGTSTSGDIMLRQTTAQMFVSADKLDFGSNEKSLSFDVVTKGDRQVEWTIKENIDWLSCSPEKGKITNSSSSVVVTIDRKGLPDGIYKDVIVVSTTDEKIPDKTVHVEMIVNRNVLKVEPVELDFGANETTLPLVLKNTGAEKLAYTVESSSEWLTPSKKTGSIDAEGNENFSVSISREGLVAATYTGTLNFAFNGISLAVPVKMTVEPATMAVSTEKLLFTADETTLSFDITTSGANPLEWYIKEDISWLSCSPDNGKMTNSSASVVVTVNRDGLEDGTYKEVLVVSSKDEKVGDKAIVVEMVVNKHKLQVIPFELDFGANETTMSLALKNTSNSALKYSVTSSDEWLIPSKTSGTISSSENFSVSVVRTGLASATYNGTLTFSFDGGSLAVPVKMTVEPATMAVSTDKLLFTADETTLSFDITTSGANPLEWYIKEDIAWLSCSPDNGKMTNSSASVVVTVNRDGLEDGTYKEVLVVSSKDEKVGDKAIVVEMIVNKNKLQVIPSELDFGGEETTLPVTLKNTGTGTLKYTVSSSNSWLVPSKTSGEVTTTDRINAIVSRQGLAVASYTGTLTFSFDGGSVNVPVKMEVEDLKAPSVSLENQVTGIGYNRATVRGMIADIGSSKITRYGFCWAEQANPTVDMGSVNLGDCTEPKSFEAIITGLQPNTTYHLRAYAENSVGLVYSGNEITFTTHDTPVLASVSTGEVSNVSDVSATVGGSISNLGNVEKLTAYGHVWSTSASQAVVGTGESTNYGALSEVRTFNSVLSDLKEKTTYYVRAYATNEMGTAYGDIVEFTTEKTPVKDVTSGLYAYYTFEDNTKNVVEGGYNATPINGPTYVESVNGTKAIKFSTMDNSYISVPEPMIDGGTFTVSFWVKGLSDGHIFHVPNTGQYEVSFSFIMKENFFAYSTKGWQIIYNYGSMPKFAHPSVDASEWTMVTLSSAAEGYGNTNVRLYLNGEFVDTYKETNVAYETAGRGTKFIFGGKMDYTSIFLNSSNMTVDNLRIYNTRALSDAEVEQIYKYESQ